MIFNQAIEIILKHEGGYVFDPDDPGGETKYGISKRSYPDLDIKNLTIGYAKFIYELDYWTKMKCDGLPRNIRLAVFDCAVNQGVYFSSKALQISVGAVADGIVGVNTIKLSNSIDEKEILSNFLQMRVSRYMINKKFKKYGRGWLLRLIDIAARSCS